MKITTDKLEEFVADRIRYFQGSLDCNRSGINDPENSKYKASIDAGIKPYLKVDRPRGEGEFEDTPIGLSFEDSEGKTHKAFGKDEKLSSSDENFSFGKIIRSKILGDFTGLNDFERKAAGEGIGALGGWLVPEQVSARVVDLARNLSTVIQAGALTIPMPTPELRIVRVTSDPTAHWVAEHGEISESDWALEPLNLKAIRLGVLVRSSLELLEDAKNAGTELEKAMAAALALEVDRIALLGTGTSEPRGLDNADDVNLISMGANGAAPTNYDEFSNAVEDISNANGIATAVIMAPRTFYTLDRLKAATTNNRLEPPQSYVDLNKFKTNQIGITDTQGTSTDASKAFVGDFKNLLYGIRKSLEIEISKAAGDKTFARSEALIKCSMRLDVAILRENHFTKIYGIIA